MGAQLVMAAYTYWSELPHGPFRLFVRMAVTAKDGDPDPRAWLGREALAEAVGLQPTPGNLRNVRRWLAQLEKAGAIERIETGRFGRRSTYLIHRMPPTEVVENRVDKAIRAAVLAGRSDPPMAGRSDPPMAGRSYPPMAGRSDPPKETFQEPMKEHREEHHVASTYSR